MQKPTGNGAPRAQGLPGRLAATAFWLLLWSALASQLPGVLFAGPVRTAKSLLALLGTAECWRSVAGTLGQIAAGFLLAFAAGLVFGALCYRSRWLRALLSPAVQGMKSVPVACFVIVALTVTFTGIGMLFVVSTDPLMMSRLLEATVNLLTSVLVASAIGFTRTSAFNGTLI